MSGSAWVLVAAAAWAVAGLAWQARRRVPPEYGIAQGSGARGIAWSFGGAMSPAHKESVGRHPVSFLLGLLLHAGVAASFALAPFGAPRLLAVPAALGLAAGVALAVKRALRLRAITTPDDLLASLLVSALLVAAVVCGAGWTTAVPLRAAAALVLFYVPLGKLRHALLFFLARGHLGWRLGVRGTYPPETARVRR